MAMMCAGSCAETAAAMSGHWSRTLPPAAGSPPGPVGHQALANPVGSRPSRRAVAVRVTPLRLPRPALAAGLRSLPGLVQRDPGQVDAGHLAAAHACPQVVCPRTKWCVSARRCASSTRWWLNSLLADVSPYWSMWSNTIW